MPSLDFNEYKSAAQFVDIDSHQIAFWHSDIDAANNVLFIHGFPSASCDWHHQWNALKVHCNLLALDLLGFGLSDKPYPYVFTLVEQARIVAQILRTIGWQNCHIVAHDYGDSVAQELLYLVETGQCDCTLQSITFLNGGLFPEAHRPLPIQKLLKSPVGRWFTPIIGEKQLSKSFHRIFGNKTPPKREEMAIIWQLLNHHHGKRCMPAILNYIDERITRRDDWLQAMRETDTKMQFINGVHDPISGEHMAQRMGELFPEVAITRLAVGHYPQLEAPEACSGAISHLIGI